MSTDLISQPKTDSVPYTDDKKNDDIEALHLDRVESGAVKYDDKQGAINAELAEQSMTFKQAIREYPAAVFWSWAISLTIIMEGYDTALPVSTVVIHLTSRNDEH